MALIPPFFLDCVVSIGEKDADKHAWFGTGFLVGRPSGEKDEKGNERYHIFVVTNKHVIENKKIIFLKFNHSSNQSAKNFEVDLLPNNVKIWVDDGLHDIAVFLINPNVLEAEKIKFNWFYLDQHVMTISNMKSAGVSEGDGIFSLGFPLGLVADEGKYNYVMAKGGSISRIRDTIEGTDPLFLIDSNIFPGNSGGPVIIKPEAMAIEGTRAIKNAALIGMIRSYIPYNDIAISLQTKKPRIIFEENSGLAQVETIDSIIKVVDLCYQQVKPKL